MEGLTEEERDLVRHWRDNYGYEIPAVTHAIIEHRNSGLWARVSDEICSFIKEEEG